MESTKRDVFSNLLPCRATVEKAADNPCIDSLCGDAAIRGHQRRFRFATAFPYEVKQTSYQEMNRLNTSPNSTETNLLPLRLSWRPLIFVAICSHDFTQKAPEPHPTHDILRSESLLHHKHILKSTEVAAKLQALI